MGTDTTWVDASSGVQMTCAVRAGGTLWCWGLNDSGQLGLGNKTNQTSPVRVGTDADWRSVATGRTHTCATQNDFTLWPRGSNGWVWVT